jgi:hypothetical protein
MNDMRYGEGATAGPLPFRPISLDLGNFATQGLAALWRVFCQSIRDTTTEQVVLYAEKYWGSVTPVIEAGLSPIVIDLVRDPRDVVVSIREFNARQGQRLFGRPGVADDGAHLRHVVGGMGFRLREMDEQLPVIRKLVRYEDMVADTAGQAALLSSLLTVDLDPYSTLLDRAQVAQHMTSPSAEYSVGRWRTELSPHDIAFIERRLGSHMIKFGYDLSSAP